MKKNYYIQFNSVLTVLSVTLFLFFSCKSNSNHGKKEISVTNWNLQTFFDGNNDGIEYPQFQKSKEVWNESLYEDRLNRLCKIIEETDSDIFVMEEMENEKIIYDISNKLSHNVWFKNKMYNYGAFSKEKGNSIGCGVISKYEIKELLVHSLDVRSESDKVPELRPIMEISINAGGENISMFINHWKSKSGGEEKSEKWRLWQENILAREVSFKNDEIVFATGDFNKDISDFNRDQDNDYFFNYIGKDIAGKKMFSPWDENIKDYGSYYFRGRWEKIDHFFSTGKDQIRNFEIVTLSDITKADGTPNKYEMYNHQGYSDHLPIKCVISIADGRSDVSP